MEYAEFLKKKSIIPPETGLKNVPALPPDMFDFQEAVTSWACRRGRAAIFAGTGMGKSFKELAWANALYEAEKVKTIIFTPLAVAAQMKREAEKFGIEVAQVHASGESECPIQITNYQKMEKFNLSEYGGVVLDESSILKNQTGKYRTQLIKSCADIPYRLAATATPSPNDYMELGNHSEFCGIMSYTDMLSTFFVHDAAKTQDWRLKGHAEDEFWRWMATWSVMYQSPEDLGYDGSRYILPELRQFQHTVGVKYEANIDTGMLFPLEAQTMGERLKARRATVDDRCEKAAEIYNENKKERWVLWCNLNDESAKLAELIPDAVELRGSMSEEQKEDILLQFERGIIKNIITKPSLTGFGLNWQFVNNTAFVGLNDSFEQIYQAVRRFWRFGQKKPVNAHFIASEIEGAVVANIKRKEIQAQHMMKKMIEHMADLSAASIKGAVRDTYNYVPTQTMEKPQWI